LIEGALQDGTPLPRIEVPAGEFPFMRWPVAHWGTRAVVMAGVGTADHLRTALQLLSGNPPRRTVYAHTGWREEGDRWVYLHAGGAIGADGVENDIAVSLPEPLLGYRLPTPPTGSDLADAIRASLRLVDLAPDRIMVPILAAVYRSVLGPVDCAVHLAGASGNGKSELAALAQQHYGAEMDRTHLPASWASTGNALEAVAFAAKDALLVVDDFAPTGSTADIQRMHREADRLLRAQGNHAGRVRMRADATLRPSRPPRGMILSTGEDVPRGQSLRARLSVIEIEPGDMPLSRLTPFQTDAAAGRYAKALAGYVRWLAPRYSSIRDALHAEVAELRGQVHVEARHGRTPGIVADLMVGWRHFLAYAEEMGSIDHQTRVALDRRAWEALLNVGASQAEHLVAAEPCDQMLRLLSASIASGRAYLASPDGGRPANPDASGWRLIEGERWEPWVA
jgi:hypothetical protein